MPVVRRRDVQVIQRATAAAAAEKQGAAGRLRPRSLWRSASGRLFAAPPPEDDDDGADQYEDVDRECAGVELEYRERHLLEAGYNWRGTVVYAMFIGLFLVQTLADRNHAYYFTQYARDVVDVAKFMDIDSSVTYVDWLEYRFFPGMHYNSVNRSTGGAASIMLVGPPRIRAIRARPTPAGAAPPGRCGRAPEMADMPVVCFDLSPEELQGNGSTAWFDEAAPWMGGGGAPAEGRVSMEYRTGAELGENPYSSYTGKQYPAGGHVVTNISNLFVEPPDKWLTGSEFFPYPHLRTDTSDLLDAGLLHPATKAIFHDFTVYSATKDAYVNLRLVLEIGLEHGMVLPTRHVRLVWLDSWPESKVVVEFLFYCLLIFHIIEICIFWVSQVRSAEEALEEGMELAHFQMRYEILQQAAFKQLVPYRPRTLLSDIEARIRKVKADRTAHISALNKLGSRVSSLHEKYRQETAHMQARHGQHKPEDKAVGILQILAAMGTLKERSDLVKHLKRTDRCGCWRRCWLRLQVGTGVLVADEWRMLDAFTYFVLLFGLFLRLRMNSFITTAEQAITDLNRTDPWADENFVQMYTATCKILVVIFLFLCVLSVSLTPNLSLFRLGRVPQLRARADGGAGLAQDLLVLQLLPVDADPDADPGVRRGAAGQLQHHLRHRAGGLRPGVLPRLLSGHQGVPHPLHVLLRAAADGRRRL